MAEIWTSFDYKTEREEDRSSPILGVPMRLRKHLSGLRNAFKKWTVDYRITCNNGNQRTLIKP